MENSAHSDPAIIGKAVTINDGPVTIVGVLPASFDFGSVFAPGKRVDLFVPAVMDFWKTWGNTLAMVGRLKPGITKRTPRMKLIACFPISSSSIPAGITITPPT